MPGIGASDTSSAESPTDASWRILAFQAATFSALVLQLLEYLNDLPSEIEFLMNTQRKPATYLYAWSRYFGLVAQLSTLALNELSNHRASWRLCKATFIARGICSQLMMSCVEAILMLRVHALYSRSRLMGRILCSTFIVGTACEIAGSSLVIHGAEPLYDLSQLPELSASMEVCATNQMGYALVLVAFGCALVQGTLVVATVGKVFANRRSNRFRTPVVSLVVRDGVAIFVVLVAIMSTAISAEIIKGRGPLAWNVSFAWLIALLSVGGCRLILNMRKVVIHPPSVNLETPITNPSTIIELDTVFLDS